MPTPRCLVSFAATLLWCTAALAQAPATPPAVPSDRPGYVLSAGTATAWTGDLDGMIQRRHIRILVPYSKTLYFVDRGTQRGMAYEVGRQFEADLNQRLNATTIRVRVEFVPVARDRIIPALRESQTHSSVAGQHETLVNTEGRAHPDGGRR